MFAELYRNTHAADAALRGGGGRGGAVQEGTKAQLVIREFIPGMKSWTENVGRFIV